MSVPLTVPLTADVDANREELLELYRSMLLIRTFELRTIELRHAHRIHGPVHPYIGQEAIAVGVCSALEEGDRLTSTHRGHGHSLAKGADPGRMLAELFGARDGYCRGKGGSMHIADFSRGVLGANGIVGAGLPIATGAALAASLEGAGRVAVCFFGEGAAAAGPFHESLNLAAIWRLPIVFVCENNGWSVDSRSADLLAAATVAELAHAHGIATRTVDGNDVLAVAHAARWAVERARRRLGPALVEAETFRPSFHATRESPAPDLRAPEVFAPWRGRNPLLRCRHELVRQGWLKEADDRALRAAADRAIEQAVAFADASPMPQPAEALDDVFAD